MPANTTPIFSRLGDAQWSPALTTADTNYNLSTPTNHKTVFVADATNGGYIQKIRVKPLGSNVATVLRVFITNGSSLTGSNDNHTLWDELTIPATTAIQTAALPTYDLPMGFALPAGYTVVVTVGTTVSAGFRVTAVGGKY
jgi:hypothetical protein